MIKGNNVSECTIDGYGVWVFAPYVSATLEDNKVSGCAVGLAAFGSQVSGQGPTFTGNTVNGGGASVSEGLTYGAYLTTDLLGFGFGDVTATLTDNSIQNFGVGVFVTQESGGQATVSGSNNVIQNEQQRRRRGARHRRQPGEQLVGLHAGPEQQPEMQRRHRDRRLHALVDDQTVDGV